MSEFKGNITLIYGEIGREWLKNLPSLEAKLAQQFGLRDLTPCPELTYNYVASGFKADLPIILKIGVDLNAIRQEYNALKAFSGNGIVEILNSDLDQGAIVLVRAVPGKTLSSLFPEHDKTALEIACNLADQIHQSTIPTNNQFPLLSEWLSIIDQAWSLPEQDLKLARNLKKELLNNSQTNALLHGDVHYANILSTGDNWIMIDPKGVIGDPLYDMAGCLLREPFKEVMESSNINRLLTMRMDFVAKYAKTDIKVIWSWTYIQTVMSICWSLEDGQDVSLKLKFLNILSGILQK